VARAAKASFKGRSATGGVDPELLIVNDPATRGHSNGLHPSARMARMNSRYPFKVKMGIVLMPTAKARPIRQAFNFPPSDLLQSGYAFLKLIELVEKTKQGDFS